MNEWMDDPDSWSAKMGEVRAADEAARARLAARHEHERRMVDAHLAGQMSTLRPGPADGEARRLRTQHEEATQHVRRGLRVAAELAPGVGIDVSDLDPESHDTSGAVKVLLERSAVVLEHVAAGVGGGGVGGGGTAGTNTATSSSASVSGSPAAASRSTRSNYRGVSFGVGGRRGGAAGGGSVGGRGGGGGGGDGILPSVMHAVNEVADVQELKAELSGMIRVEAAERMVG